MGPIHSKRLAAVEALGVNFDADWVRVLNGALSGDDNRANEKGWTPLLVAAKEGHSKAVEEFLSRREVNVHHKGGDCDRNALHMSAYRGHEKVVHLLLRLTDVNVNARSKDGHTALMLASQGGHASVVSLLVCARGVDVNAANTDGCTALFAGTANRHIDVVKVLLHNSDVDANIVGGRGQRSPLMNACISGDFEIAKMLVKQRRDLDVNILDARKESAFGCVAYFGRARIGRLLLRSNQVNVSLVNDRDCAAVQLACLGVEMEETEREDKFTVLQILLRHVRVTRPQVPFLGSTLAAQKAMKIYKKPAKGGRGQTIGQRAVWARRRRVAVW